jgi:hypothetical protein
MKNNIKKFLICAFVSAVGVVSPWGDIDLSQPNTEVVAQTEADVESLYSWDIIDNTVGVSLARSIENANVIINENEDTIVSSSMFEFNDGWTNKTVNVRKEPNTDSEILEVYEFNTYVSHSEFDDEWSIIEYGDDYAYIYSKYISNEECNYRSVYIPNYSGTKTWMAYTAITMKSSPQYRLQQVAYTGKYGIRMYDGRYCIAVGTGVTSNIGTYVDLVLANGTVLQCVIGDIKANAHTNSSNLMTIHSNCCSEFIIDIKNLNSMAKRMGDMSYVCNEWKSRVVEIRVYDVDVIN